MNARILILPILLSLLLGCTAYRTVSIAYIEGEDDWVARNGYMGGGMREASVVENEQMRFVVSPCNYGKKHVFMLIPPIPLGSLPGCPVEEGFVVYLSIRPGPGSASRRPGT